MAPRSKPYKKWPKKTTMAAAKKMVTKQHKVKAKKNMDTFFLKTKNVITLTPTQGVAVSNYVYNAFTLDPTGTGTAQYITNAEFQLYRGQYDKFRVNSMKIIVSPKANVLDQINAQADNLYNTVGDGMVHHVIDRDSIAPSNIARLSRYPSYRKNKVDAKWSRTYSVRYPTGVWLDCDAPANFSMAKELGLSGGITLYAESVLEDNGELFNEPWAQVEIQYNIVFQGKVQGNLTGVYDPSGNLVGVQLGFTSNDTNLAQSPLFNLRGSLGADQRLVDTTTTGPPEVPITDSGIA